MTDAEQREAARQFVNRWMGKGKEDEDGRSYWIDLLTNVLGMDNVTERLNFEKKVVIDGNTKRIDVYIPETRVIIEQKSLGKALDQKIRNSGDVDLTPFEQADRYNGKLTFDERARWIVTSNFAEIWIYDMNQKQPEPTKIALDELQSKYPLLDFLVEKKVKTISHEMEVSIKAGDIVGLIYDAFLKQYRIPDIKEKDETSEQKEKREHKLKSLNALCVRIVFCLYAEDAGILGKRNMFHDYLVTYEVRDCRRALIELFKVLDTPISDRDEYLEEDLAQFPYVNGGLFADETIEIPPFTEEIKELLLTKASEDFDWSDISPTIFGAVFESTLNPETRRSGGMHYTSIENIHKVIDPLFLEDLQKEFNAIKQIQVKRTKDKKLDEFQNKLATLTFLDPACGSGNFLTETYLSLRRLENEVIRERVGGQITLGEVQSPRPPDLYVGQLTYRSSQQVHLLEVVASARLPSALYGVEERDVAQVGLQVAHLVVACGQYLRHGQLSLAEMLCQADEGMVLLAARAHHPDDRVVRLVRQSVVDAVAPRALHLLYRGRLAARPLLIKSDELFHDSVDYCFSSSVSSSFSPFMISACLRPRLRWS